MQCWLCVWGADAGLDWLRTSLGSAARRRCPLLPALLAVSRIPVAWTLRRQPLPPRPLPPLPHHSGTAATGAAAAAADADAGAAGAVVQGIATAVLIFGTSTPSAISNAIDLRKALTWVSLQPNPTQLNTTRP